MEHPGDNFAEYPQIDDPGWNGLISWQSYQVLRLRRMRRELYPVEQTTTRRTFHRQVIQPGGCIFPDEPELTGAGDAVIRGQLQRVLDKNPDCDMVYFWGRSQEGQPPRTLASEVGNGGLFLTRRHVEWMLGAQADSEPSPGSFWFSASLLFNCRALISPGVVESTNADSLVLSTSGTALFSRLQASSTAEQQVLADFIRDFHLSPWICYLDVIEDRAGKDAGEFISQLKSGIQRPGNILVEINRSGETSDDISGQLLTGESIARNYPSLFAPIVYLQVRHSAKDARPEPGLPAYSLKVLLSITGQDLPDHVDPEWDLCLAMKPAGQKAVDVPLLPRPWQGWVAGDLQSLLDLLDVRIHAHHIREIEAYQSEPGELTTRLTVVICTYHRTEALRQALQSIAAQTFPAGNYEVIVVNNDPGDSQTRLVVDEVRAVEFSGNPEALRLVETPLPGLSYARNAALSEARGRVMCFIDDDATARPDWLDQISWAFDQHPGVGVVGGHIFLKAPQPRPDVLKDGLERFWTQFITSYQDYTEVDSWMDYPWGANWCILRDALLQMGGFRGQYGRRQRDFSGGEELIAASLAQRLGYEIGIQPQAVVDHIPDASRFTYSYLRKTIISQIMVNYRMKRDFYLPESVTVMGNLKGTGRFARNILKMIHLPANERQSLTLEYFYMIQAWFRLLLEQLGDAWARFWLRG